MGGNMKHLKKENLMKNRNRKTWTDTDNRKLIRMYRSGRLTIPQIADRLGRTYFAIVKRASRLSLMFGIK